MDEGNNKARRAGMLLACALAAAAAAALAGHCSAPGVREDAATQAPQAQEAPRDQAPEAPRPEPGAGGGHAGQIAARIEGMADSGAPDSAARGIAAALEERLGEAALSDELSLEAIAMGGPEGHGNAIVGDATTGIDYMLTGDAAGWSIVRDRTTLAQADEVGALGGLLAEEPPLAPSGEEGVQDEPGASEGGGAEAGEGDGAAKVAGQNRWSDLSNFDGANFAVSDAVSFADEKGIAALLPEEEAEAVRAAVGDLLAAEGIVLPSAAALMAEKGSVSESGGKTTLKVMANHPGGHTVLDVSIDPETGEVQAELAEEAAR